jgi:hypothetical protein
MFKQDPIFWWASSLFVLSLLLVVLTQNQLWLALMMGSYLLRPTLASLGVAKRFVDERQLSIHYRSSNIGFVVMLIACVFFAAKLGAEDNPTWEYFNMLILLGLATKALFNVVLVSSLREAATKIILTAGLLMTLFIGMESINRDISLNVLLNLLPGLTLIGLGLLSKQYPRAIGVVILLITVALEVAILGKGNGWGQIITGLVVGVPLVVAGVCLFTHPNSS